MKLKIKMDRSQWTAARTKAEVVIATGMTKAMREAGKRAAGAANANIHAAGFARRKWELRAKNYPSSGVSLLPEVWLHSRVNFEDVFTEGRTVQGNPWLWIPLPSVPPWPGDSTRQMSPKKYIQTIGPLVTMRRRGKPPLLGAVVSGALRPQPFGRFVTRGRLRKGKTGKGPTTVIPLFVGVRSIVIEKKFEVQDAVDQVMSEFPSFYANNESKEVI